MDNILSIKASIAALVLGGAMLSISQAGNNTAFEVAANSESGKPPVANLTTKTKISSMGLENAPGWNSVADQYGKSGCMQNLTSKKILCGVINLRKLAEQAQP
jgi:hypothetical protein